MDLIDILTYRNGNVVVYGFMDGLKFNLGYFTNIKMALTLPRICDSIEQAYTVRIKKGF